MNWNNIGIFLLILLAWFALNRWVLPWAGVGTCMSGACGVIPATDPQTTLAMKTAKTEDEPMSTLVEFSDVNFEDQVLRAARPVLVDFSATWCGPCKMLAPVIEQLAEENAGNVIVGKLDVDTNPLTAARYGVSSIPTVLVFNEGQVVETFVGLQPKAKFQDSLARIVQ